MDSTSAIAKRRLDPNKALDVAEVAAILGTTTQPLECDKWLASLLKGKPPTFENKLDAVCTSGVTHKFLNDDKATIAHPEINHYKKLAARVRAVRGFSEWLSIHESIAEEAPRSCPTDMMYNPWTHHTYRSIMLCICCYATCSVVFLGPMSLLLAGCMDHSRSILIAAIVRCSKLDRFQ